MRYERTIRRLIWMVPALFIVSMLAFFLSKAIPGDPAEAYLQNTTPYLQQDQRLLEQWQAYRQTVRALGLDKPLFYFSIHSHVLPDTLYKIPDPEERAASRKLALKTGDWQGVEKFRSAVYDAIYNLEETIKEEQPAPPMRNWQNELAFILLDADEGSVLGRLDRLRSSPAFKSAGSTIRNMITGLRQQAIRLFDRKGKLIWLPAFSWHGMDNQFHHWFSGVLRGDFGVSARDAQPVFSRIRESLQWTLLLNGAALILAFLAAVPLGVWLARARKPMVARWTRAFLFMVYAIPSFWLATILVVFFTTPEYGQWLDWFPTQGLGNYRDAGNWVARAGILVAHLFLPVCCLAAGSLAYLAQQMKQSLEQELRSDYVLFFRSFGLGEGKAVWLQAFRNALFPMITILGGAIPALFSGSLIIEVIFNIPGMGRLMYSSILAKDWNVVFGILLMVSAITMISYLLTDIGYQLADPKLRSGNVQKAAAR